MSRPRLTRHQREVFEMIARHAQSHTGALSINIGCRQACRHLTEKGYITTEEIRGPLGGTTWRYHVKENSMTRVEQWESLSRARIPWGRFSSDKIQAIFYEAQASGDADLARKADQALIRRVGPNWPTLVSKIEWTDETWNPTTGCDRVIVGGESGPGARPMDLGWARDILARCREAGAAPFVKQLGSCWGGTTGDRKGGAIETFPADLQVREMPA